MPPRPKSAHINPSGTCPASILLHVFHHLVAGGIESTLDQPASAKGSSPPPQRFESGVSIQKTNQKHVLLYWMAFLEITVPYLPYQVLPAPLSHEAEFNVGSCYHRTLPPQTTNATVEAIPTKDQPMHVQRI